MEDRTKLFDGYLSNHYEHVRGKGHLRHRKMNYLRANYERFLPPNRQARILDIGPGYGEFLEMLHKGYGFINAHGIDLSREVVDYCNTITPNSCTHVGDSTEYLKQHVGEFDCIFMMHILEHIPKSEIIAFLTAVYQALTPDGYLVIEVPNMANPITGLNIRYADFTHEVGFTELSLGYVLKSVGFSVVTTFGSKLPFDSYFRIPQYIVQEMAGLVISLLYRGYASKRPHVITPNLCAIARK